MQKAILASFDVICKTVKEGQIPDKVEKILLVTNNART